MVSPTNAADATRILRWPQRRDRLDLSRAIDHAGPVLFGADWIGRLSPSEANVLRKHGPQPYGQAVQSIQPCPTRAALRLDRAIGRDARMGIQRAAVLNWLLAARVMASRDYCDLAALDRALAASGRTLPAPGRPANARDRVLQKMLEEMRAWRLTPAKLSKMKQETLAQDYGASRKVCEVARRMALSEAVRLAALK